MSESTYLGLFCFIIVPPCFLSSERLICPCWVTDCFGRSARFNLDPLGPEEKHIASGLRAELEIVQYS